MCGFVVNLHKDSNSEGVMKFFPVIFVAIVSFMTGLVLGIVWRSTRSIESASVASRPTQAKVNAALAAPTPSPPAAPAPVAAPAIDCEKYDGLMLQCVKDFDSVRVALEAANDAHVPPTEERDFEALSAANEVALGTCIDILMRHVMKDDPSAPVETSAVLQRQMQCPSTRRAMEHDARLLEQWHIVQTRSAERCGLVTPCQACKKFGRSAQSCVGVAAPEARLKILKKGTASRIILSSFR